MCCRPCMPAGGRVKAPWRIHPLSKRKGNKIHPIHNDFDTLRRRSVVYIYPIKQNVMENLKRKGKLMFALEIILYFIIAVSVALAIIL